MATTRETAAFDEARQIAKDLWALKGRWDLLKDEHSAQDYANTMPDGDPDSSNAGYTAADFITFMNNAYSGFSTPFTTYREQITDLL